ncbi:hypothetical protein HNQ63_001625 [Wenzhouxiangella marina]|uniref:Uncharacterized protein n=1 Tax=Wenzhouxiangella marina TaxID=1579979 RepID=A0A0K0XZU1_9GAMM|nr:hypothetical protein WM2015_2805 [Wenzhouxiangella marina]MBB6087153.1 hypothetical protein [Wenzhouxiangella marina]
MIQCCRNSSSRRTLAFALLAAAAQIGMALIVSGWV